MSRTIRIGIGVIAGFWLLIIAVTTAVIYGDDYRALLPRHVYTHPEDGYRFSMPRGWEAREATAKHLILTDENGNEIRFWLEVGGYDHLPVTECAKRWIAACGDDVTFDDESPAATDTDFPGVTFTGTAKNGLTTIDATYVVLHPADAIRLYIIVFGDADLETILTSLSFSEPATLYRKYMRIEDKTAMQDEGDAAADSP